MYPYRNFPLFYRIFPQINKMFRKTNEHSLEFSKCSPIRRCVRRTEDYPILETFLVFITGRRFGGVGAQEGLENVPDIYTKISRKISVSAFLLWHYDTKPFRKIPKLPAKNTESGHLTCDFLAPVEG